MPQKKKGANTKFEDLMELRRGPWTLEEDSLLIHYIARHGEGQWNLLARCSGLKRTGKSCRLRWLNYLKPDVKRGNLSPEEQFLILELHSKWGNRWSRIAQYLPGRTDNEIKNYWRTRVQKRARQLKIDTSSAMFRDAVRSYWMPRLLEKMASKNTSVVGPTISTQASLITQPAHFSPHLLAQDHFNQITTNQHEILDGSMNYSGELMQKAEGASTDINAVSDVIENTNDIIRYGLDSLGLESGSLSGVGDLLQSDCVNNGGSNVWVDDQLWGLDELWHVRKQDE